MKLRSPEAKRPGVSSLPDLDRFERLREEFQYLRWTFLRSELALSYTLATLADASYCSHQFREACRTMAEKGYRTVLRFAPPAALPREAEAELVHQVDLLRKALAQAGAQSGSTRGETKAAGGNDGARTETSPEVLTPREIEVLQRIAKGDSTKEIAAALGISFKTSACHRYRLMEKLGVHETANLVRYAIRHGLVQA